MSHNISRRKLSQKTALRIFKKRPHRPHSLNVISNVDKASLVLIAHMDKESDDARQEKEEVYELDKN